MICGIFGVSWWIWSIGKWFTDLTFLSYPCKIVFLGEFGMLPNAFTQLESKWNSWSRLKIPSAESRHWFDCLACWCIEHWILSTKLIVYVVGENRRQNRHLQHRSARVDSKVDQDLTVLSRVNQWQKLYQILSKAVMWAMQMQWQTGMENYEDKYLDA